MNIQLTLSLYHSNTISVSKNPIKQLNTQLNHYFPTKNTTRRFKHPVNSFKKTQLNTIFLKNPIKTINTIIFPIKNTTRLFKHPVKIMFFLQIFFLIFLFASTQAIRCYVGPTDHGILEKQCNKFLYDACAISFNLNDPKDLVYSWWVF